MRHTLHLAVTLALLAAAPLHAQVSNPDKLIAPAPQPPRHVRPIAGDDLQWIWQYTHPNPVGRATDLRFDARFQAMVATNFKQPQGMWGPQTDVKAGSKPVASPPLSTIIPLFLSQHGTVTADDNRYIAVDGCVPSFCPAAGLLWLDLGTPHPLMVFAAVNWIADNHTPAEPSAGYELWLFPNRDLDANALPFALTAAIAHWNIRLAAAHRLVPHIVHALLVEPSGTPFTLDPQLAGSNSIAPQPDTSETQNPPLATQN